MKIHFDNNGQDCIANVHYNFKDVDDCIIIVFETAFRGSLIFNKENNIWSSASVLKTAHPVVYHNIQVALLETFRIQEDAGTNDSKVRFRGNFESI